MADTSSQQSVAQAPTPQRVTELFRGQTAPAAQQPAEQLYQPQVAQSQQPPEEQPRQPGQHILAQEQTPPAQPQPSEPQAQPQQQAPQPPQPDQTHPQEDYYDDDYDYPELFPGVAKPIPEQTIYEWQAPSRPFKQHNRQYYTTVGTIVLLISLILFFAGQWLPIAVVIAVAFLSYVMSSISPHTVTIKITNYGVRLEQELYYWEELGWFWFKEKHEQEVLYVETSRFPNRLALMVGKGDKEMLRALFSEVLLEQEPPPTYFEKAAAWLQEKFPLDIES